MTTVPEPTDIANEDDGELSIEVFRKLLGELAAEQVGEEFPDAKAHPLIGDQWEENRCPRCGGADVVVIGRAWPFEVCACAVCDAAEIAEAAAHG